MGGAGIPPRDLLEILQELFKLVEAHADFILTLLADSGGSLIMYIFHWSVQLCRQFFFFFFFMAFYRDFESSSTAVIHLIIQSYRAELFRIRGLIATEQCLLEQTGSLLGSATKLVAKRRENTIILGINNCVIYLQYQSLTDRSAGW